MDLFFSVIIPTLNEEGYLPLLLNDFSQQKEKNFEVIIVDGASIDKTKEKALLYENKFPLYFYENERKNVSYQRNFGAGKAKGKYLIFLDADCRIKPSFTHILHNSILKRKGLVFIPYSIPDIKSPQADFVFKMSNFLIELSLNTARPFTNGGNMIWEKNFFYLIGGFDEKLLLSEDHDIVQRASLWGVKAKFLNRLKFNFSLRRAKNEGQLALLYKYLVATAYLILKGDIKKKIFEYKMGGGTDTTVKKSLTFKQNFKYYLKQLKQFFNQDIS